MVDTWRLSGIGVPPCNDRGENKLFGCVYVVNKSTRTR